MAEGRRHSTIREGIFAGILGAAAVALWFFILDVLQGRLLFTPAALGSAFFFGARDVNAVQVTTTTVLGYTLIHGAVFLAVGYLAARFIHAAEKEPVILLGAILVFVTLEVLFVGLIALIATWLMDTLPLWSIGMANLIAGVVMGVYLYRTHPRLRRQLRQPLEEEAAAA